MLQRIAILMTAVLSFCLTPLMAENEYAIEAQELAPVHPEFIVEQETIKPGRPFWIGIRLTLDKKWHAYWKNPGDAGMAPAVEWKLPEGYMVRELVWPVPKRFSLNDAISFGYEDELIL